MKYHFIFNKKKQIFNGIIALLFLIILFISISFLFPGNLKIVDNIRFTLQSEVIRLTDKIDDGLSSSNHKLIDRYTENAILFDELTPYLETLNPGTLIFSSHGRNVCALIPGKWKHSVVYIGSIIQVENYFGTKSKFYNMLLPYYKTENEYLIVDGSFNRGVAIRCISSLANLNTRSTLRSILCFEPNIDSPKTDIFLKMCFNELGKGYDLNFLLDNDNEIYCTELIYNSLLPIGIDANYTSFLWGRKIILPIDMVKYIFNEGLNKKEFIYKIGLVKNEDVIIPLSMEESIIDFVDNQSNL